MNGMNINNRTWIEKKAILNRSVSFLEVGSFIVQGQENIQCRKTIEPLVKEYIGLDMRPGDGVDIVANAKLPVKFIPEKVFSSKAGPQNAFGFCLRFA